MAKAVLTVAVKECWRCKQLLKPEEEYVWRQAITAVETGGLVIVNRYELMPYCLACTAVEEQRETAERQRKWWFRFWCVVVGACLLTAPYGYLLLAGAIIWRVRWKQKTLATERRDV